MTLRRKLAMLALLMVAAWTIPAALIAIAAHKHRHPPSLYCCKESTR